MKAQGSTWTVCRNCDHTAWWHDGVRCHWRPCRCAAFLAGPGPQSPDPEWRLNTEGNIVAPFVNEGTL